MERNCDICQKNKATIHVQQIMGNREVDLHICDECAFENGISREDDKIEVSLAGLFAGMLDIQGDLVRAKVAECPSCGMTVKQFRKDLRPGCPGCFSAFDKEIKLFFQERGMDSPYSGRLPKKLQAFRALYQKKLSLQEELKTAIGNEEYEKAAEIRDRLKGLDEDRR